MVLSSDWNPLDKRTDNHLPCREIPSVVPFKSEISWNLDLTPVITALRDICKQPAEERRGMHQFSGVETKLPTNLYAWEPFAIPEINGSVRALSIAV